MQSEERAKFLSERARAMLEVGFEAALDGFQPSAKSCRSVVFAWHHHENNYRFKQQQR